MNCYKVIRAVSTEAGVDGKKQEAKIQVLVPVAFEDILEGVKAGDKKLAQFANGRPLIFDKQFVVQAVKEKLVSDIGVDWRTQFRAKTATIGGKKIEVEQVKV